MEIQKINKMRTTFLKSEIFKSTGKEKYGDNKTEYVYFSSTHVYATNGYVGVKQCLETFHDFGKEERKIVEGKYLHHSKFKNLKAKRGKFFKITEEGIKIREGGGVEILINWCNTSTVPDFYKTIEEVIPKIEELEKTDVVVAISYTDLSKAVEGAKMLDVKEPRVTFYKGKKQETFAIVINDRRDDSPTDYQVYEKNSIVISRIIYEEEKLIKK